MEELCVGIRFSLQALSEFDRRADLKSPSHLRPAKIHSMRLHCIAKSTNTADEDASIKLYTSELSDAQIYTEKADF